MKKTNETSKQIYVTVVTSSLSMLANRISTTIQPNEDIFDVCSELANEVAKENGLNWSNVLVQYFDNYSDEIAAIPLKIPNKPKTTRELALEWWKNLRRMTILEGNGVGGVRRSWDLVNKYFPDQIPSGKGMAFLEAWQIEEIWRKENTIVKHIGNSNLVNESGTVIHKLNQKQFKEFKPQLFSSYISKFNLNDKYHATTVALCNLNLNSDELAAILNILSISKERTS